MSATPQEDASLAKASTDGPRLSRRTLLKGAGGLAVLGGGSAAWYVWHGRQPLHSFSGNANHAARVAFSPDGATLADAADFGTVRLWRVSDGTLLRTFKSEDSKGLRLYSVAFAPNGESIIAGGTGPGVVGETGVIFQWRVGDGALAWEITAVSDTSPIPPGKRYIIPNDVAYAPDGALIASGTDSGYVYLWRASDGQFVRKMKDPQAGHTVIVHNVAFSPDGQIIAAGMGDYIGRTAQAVLLWRVSDGMLIRNLEVDGTDVAGLSFSPDGQTLLAGSASPRLNGDKLVNRWRLSDGELFGSLRAPATATIFAPDGQTFAAAQGRDVQVRRLDGTVVHSITAGKEGVGSIAFSPDGRLLATASRASSISMGSLTQIWRLR